jgi:hypothetical protein
VSGTAAGACPGEAAPGQLVVPKLLWGLGWFGPMHLLELGLADPMLLLQLGWVLPPPGELVMQLQQRLWPLKVESSRMAAGRCC